MNYWLGHADQKVVTHEKGLTKGRKFGASER
jgi:hypothetical protein